MQKKIDVLTFGDLCVDLIINCAGAVPEFGQKEKLVGDYSLELGGSSCIFACQTAKLGLKTAVLGKAGADQFGDFTRMTLKRSGVNTKLIKRDKGYTTGLTVALKNADDRAMLTYNGTIDAIGYEDISDDLLKSVRHFHIGSYFLMKKIQPYYPLIIKVLKSYGSTISLDTNWDPDEKWDSGIWNILPYVDIFLPNENEVLAITGEKTIEKAVNRLKSIIPVIAVKKGREGAYVCSGENIYRVPAIEVEKVDAIGAGDTFDGGFIYGMLQNMGVENSARIGCICGSLNTRRAGGTKGQPGLAELKTYLNNM